MKWPTSQDDVPAWRNATEDPCVMAVFYEDTPSRNRATELCHRLTRECQGEVPLAITWWKFNCLQEPYLAQEATHAAAHADVILVASSSQSALPQVVSESLSRCACLRSKPEGIIAAMVHETDHAALLNHPVVRHLRSLASMASMDFLPHAHPEHAMSHEEMLRRLDHRAHDLSSTLREAMMPHSQSRF